MSASSSDYLTKVGSPGTATTLSAPGHTIGGTAITVVSTSNWPTDTGCIFAMDTYTLVSGVAVRDVGSYCEFEGIVSSGTSITSMVLRYGTDQNYPAGSTSRVYIPVASSRENRLVDGLLVAHDQDGTLKAGAVDVAAVLASNVVTTAKILDANVTNAKLAADISPVKFANPYKFSAYRNAALTPTSAVIFDTEEFDTGNNYDTSNGRFTAPVAGFYQINAQLDFVCSASIQNLAIYLQKNGSQFKVGSQFVNMYNGATSIAACTLSTLVKLEIGDYLYIGVVNSPSLPLAVSSATNYFQGFLVSTT